MATVALAGSTGLIGSNILAILQNHSGASKIYAFARKDVAADSRTEAIVASDSASWPAKYPGSAQLYMSALGTTRANAGGLENQRKIDYDLNLELAKAAQATGTKAYVLISSSGASASSPMAYVKMKGELEEAVKALDMEHIVIVRPGLIVGDRNESRMAEGVFRSIARFAGSVSGNKLKDFWAQDADVIAKAAVTAGMDAIEGRQTGKVRLLEQAEIVKLGRTEWKA